jgi:maltose alpha-D-glucosyltransferase/alpha-amylase
MGDNIWLHDRDAVRTPMQWTPDRNAGFSSADPGKLYLPVISSLVYHYNNVNVEAQMASGSSLLHWTRGMLQVRAAHEVFGLGEFHQCEADNDTVLAFVRVLPEDDQQEREGHVAVLCVNNLSSRPQAARIALPERLHGSAVRDLFGGHGFPSIDEDGTVTLTLGSRSFFWLGLTPPAPPVAPALPAATTTTPTKDS